MKILGILFILIVSAVLCPTRSLATPVKIGFHVGVGGNRTGIGDWERSLDNAGIPFFLKSVDDAGAIYEAQILAKASGVPHVLVYRNTQADTPDYNLSPVDAARVHWQFHVSRWPPELDKTMVWYETINEVDKNRSEWMAEFAIETARLAGNDGFKWAAFGWSTGEPEPNHWEGPKMLEFLRLVGNNPNRLAIALHEYSLRVNDIRFSYPYLLGRFMQLYSTADRYGIPRPIVLITEWGWEATTVPSPDVAISDITWANNLYAGYPQVKGAALWYLGSGFGDIANQAQKLIAPVTQWSLSTAGNNPTPTPTQAPISGDSNGDRLVNPADIKFILTNWKVTTGLNPGFGADQRADQKVNGLDFAVVAGILVNNGTPYTGTAITIPGTIQVENYNTGGEGIAYHDDSAGNIGGAFRNDDVDIENTLDTGGGANVGWIGPGEWLKYSINASTTKAYSANLRLANLSAGGSLHLEIDGVNVTGPIGIPNTGNWQTFQTVTATTGQITSGLHILKIVFDSPGTSNFGGNINWISLN